MTAIRSPAVAGQFYDGTATGLREQIESTFTHEVGPGSIPTPEADKPAIQSIVSPHAGYPYSGPVAAHGFTALADAGTPDAVVIAGPNHSAAGEPVAVTEADAWETPLGTVPIHEALRQELLSDSDVIVADERTHAGEHSIEVQVPFLQYLFGEVPILPIAMTDQTEATAMALASSLGAALAATDESVTIVASTDFTHYEPREVAKRQDRKAIDRINALDATGLLATVADEHISMCGYGPTAAAVETVSRGGGTEGELLTYATSGDTAGSPRQVVGYASMALK